MIGRSAFGWGVTADPMLCQITIVSSESGPKPSSESSYGRTRAYQRVNDVDRSSKSPWTGIVINEENMCIRGRD